MTLSRGEGVALWRQVAQSIEADIQSGHYRPGDRLPTEAALTTRFGVNRHTVRRAVSVLEAAGLVRAEQGRGTFVHEAVIDYPIGKRTRFSETLERQARDPDRELLDSTVTEADRPVADALAIPEGDPVERLELLGKSDGRKVSLATHYFPAALFAGFGEAYASAGTVTAALRSFGVEDYTRRSTRVIARPADTREQNLLELPRHRPVLITESVNVDSAGRIIEYGVARFAADRVQLVFTP